MKLREWVKVVLRIIMCISFFTLGTDITDMKTHILVHIIACFVFVLNAIILVRCEVK